MLKSNRLHRKKFRQFFSLSSAIISIITAASPAVAVTVSTDLVGSVGFYYSGLPIGQWDIAQSIVAGENAYLNVTYDTTGYVYSGQYNPSVSIFDPLTNKFGSITTTISGIQYTSIIGQILLGSNSIAFELLPTSSYLNVNSQCAQNLGSCAQLGLTFGSNISSNSLPSLLPTDLYNPCSSCNELVYENEPSSATQGFAVFINTAQDAGAVPESSTWITALVGFGIIGCALRAHRQQGFRLADA